MYIYIYIYEGSSDVQSLLKQTRYRPDRPIVHDSELTLFGDSDSIGLAVNCISINYFYLISQL